MEISKNEKKDWDMYIEYGDIKKIAEKAGKHRETIGVVVRTGKGTIENILAVREFVNDKKKLIAA